MNGGINMTEKYYKEDHNDKYVEVEKYGIINLSELPIVIDKSKCHQIEWAHVMNGEGAGKHVLSETSGCSPIAYGGCSLKVIKSIGIDIAE